MAECSGSSSRMGGWITVRKSVAQPIVAEEEEQEEDKLKQQNQQRHHAAAMTGKTRDRKKRKQVEDDKKECPPMKLKSQRKSSKKTTEREKRLLPFVPRPSSAVSDRIKRAFVHRLYLIDKKFLGPSDAPSSCEFFVLGATGNVYTVKLDLIPSCNCPDFAKGNTCKHILFVMLRVLKLSKNDPVIWQKALLPSEFCRLSNIFTANIAAHSRDAVADDDNSVLASGHLRERFHQIVDASKVIDDSDGLKPGQREVSGVCPVCYEPLMGEDGKVTEPVVFCKTCGNNIHSDCFRRWSETKGQRKVTCIYCRTPWVRDDAVERKGGYINLASYSEAHHSADTSLAALYPSMYWLH